MYVPSDATENKLETEVQSQHRKEKRTDNLFKFNADKTASRPTTLTEKAYYHVHLSTLLILHFAPIQQFKRNLLQFQKEIENYVLRAFPVSVQMFLKMYFEIRKMLYHSKHINDKIKKIANKLSLNEYVS